MDNKSDKKPIMSGALFAASNSADGFKSYYAEIFNKEKYKRRYIIKGGPGTGKSRFMREVADSAEKKGYCVEYYNCSSDPDSLDGLIIDDSIVLLDGTSPHACDCEIAGARDEIVNLGAFWNGEELVSRFSEIEALSKRKSELYKKAYKYLAACGKVSEINSELVFGGIRHSKLSAAVERLLESVHNGDGFEVTPALTDSVGMRGRVKFDTYEKCAKKLYYIVDWYSSAHFYLSAVIACAKRKNIKLRVSYDPICPQYPDGVYFCNSGMAFVIADSTEVDLISGTKINMKRFVDARAVPEFKKEFRYNSKLYEALLSSAIDALCEAGESHFMLEEIYSRCMDFSAKEKYTASFCEMICNILQNT